MNESNSTIMKAKARPQTRNDAWSKGVQSGVLASDPAETMAAAAAAARAPVDPPNPLPLGPQRIQAARLLAPQLPPALDRASLEGPASMQFCVFIQRLSPDANDYVVLRDSDGPCTDPLSSPTLETFPFTCWALPDRPLPSVTRRQRTRLHPLPAPRISPWHPSFAVRVSAPTPL